MFWIGLGLLLSSILLNIADCAITDGSTSGCGGIFKADSGSITSPNYPDIYPDGKLCTWVIVVNDQSRLELTFKDLDIEGPYPCLYDSVSIRDGPDDDSFLLAKHCGSTIPKKVASSGNVLMVQFSSDSAFSLRGFNATWTAVPKITINPGTGPEPFGPWSLLAVPTDIVTLDAGLSNVIWAIDEGDIVYVLSNGRWRLVEGRLSDVTTGDSGTFGLDKNGKVYYREGVSIAKPEGTNWIDLSSTEKTPNLKKIDSGMFNFVLAVDGSGRLYYRDGLTQENPQGESWKVLMDNDGIKDISCGTYSCWALRYNNELIAAPYPLTLQPTDMKWTIIGTQVDSITAGFGGRVFITYANGEVYTRAGITGANPLGNSFSKVAGRTLSVITSGLTGTIGVLKDGRGIKYEGIECGGLITSDSGTFSTPNHPKEYPPNVHCLWIFRNRTSKTIQLDFKSNVDIDYRQPCRDYILTYATGVYPSVPGFSCSKDKGLSSYTNEEIWIEFHSDDTIEKSGFIATYNFFNEIPTTVQTVTTLPDRSTPTTISSRSTPTTYEKTTAKETVPTTAKTTVVPFPTDWSIFKLDKDYNYVIPNGPSSWWGVMPDGRIYIYNGKTWSLLNDKTRIRHVSIGESGKWAVTKDGQIVYRTGVTEENLDGTDWVVVTRRGLKDVVSGPYGLVFALRNDGQVVHRYGITESSPIGTQWQTVPGNMKHITVGTYGLWALDSSGNTYFGSVRRDPITTDVTISWDLVPGIFNSLQTGDGGNVWAIDKNGNVFTREGVNALNSKGSRWVKIDYITGKDISYGYGNVLVIGDDGNLIIKQKPYCGGVLTEKEGSFSTPNYPLDYPSSTKCIWVIRVPYAQRIDVQFMSFNLESSPRCSNDRIVTYTSGRFFSNAQPVVECGSLIADKVIDGNEFWIEFHSDDFINSKGFLVKYKSYDELPPVITTPTVPPTTTKPQTTPDVSEPFPSDWIRSPENRLVKIDSGTSTQFWGIDSQNNVYVRSVDRDLWLLVDDGKLIHVTSGESGVWGVTIDGQVVYRNGITQQKPDGTSWIPISGNRLRQIESGPFGVVYALTDSSSLYYRTGITKDNPTGTGWENIPGSYRQISSSSFGNWIISNNGNVYFARGSTSNPSLLTNLKPVEGSFKKVSAGHGNFVWALGQDGNVYRRLGVSMSQPEGISWLRVKGLKLKEVASGLPGAYGIQIDNTLVFKAAPDCGGVSSSQRGSISSVNYPRRYPSLTNCLWNIRVPGADEIKVTITNIDIQSTGQCASDWIAITDSYPVLSGIKRICTTQSQPIERIYQSDNILVEFVSDDVIEGNGFLLSYEAIFTKTSPVTLPITTRPIVVSTSPYGLCGGNFNADKGEFVSPNYPRKYAQNLKCSWTITAPPGEVVTVVVKSTDIEEDLSCRYDYLLIKDGVTISSPIIKRLCGSQTISQKFRSSGREMFLYFESDETKEGKGFEISWEFVKSQPTQQPITTPTGTTTVRTRPVPVTAPVPNGWEVLLSNKDYFYVDTGLTRNPWVLDSRGTPYVNVLGVWTPVNDVLLTHVTSGGSGVWGVNRNGKIVYRDGISTINPSGTSWIMIDGPNFLTIDSGPNGFVIAVTSSGDTRYRYGISNDRPYGTAWQSLNRQFDYVTVGSHSIWGVDPTGYVYATARPGDLSATQLPWMLVSGEKMGSIEAGPGGQVWAIALDGEVFKRIGISTNQPFGIRWQSQGFKLRSVSSGVQFVYGIDLYGRLLKTLRGHQCGGLLTEEQGTFSTPNFPGNYENNQMCLWIIKVPDAKQIKIRFSSFQLEQSDKCQKDYLLTYKSGVHANEGKRVFECGNTVNEKTIDGNEAWVEFSSDDENTRSGFTGEYRAMKVVPPTLPPPPCSGSYTDSRGTISSPNFPNDYPPNQECQYTITVSRGSTIQARFEFFNLEGSLGCESDHVAIGNIQSSDGISRYCGTSIPSIVKTGSNQMSITFVSDSSVSDSGFLLRWIEVQPLITTSQPTTVPTTTKVVVTTPTCSGSYTDSRGTISSPNFPNDYPPNQECQYTITVSRGSTIQARFEFFNLEGSLGCESDYVAIGNIQSSDGISRYCGSTIPSIVKTGSNQMSITFVSDSSVSDSGFLLRWIEVQPLITTSQPTTVPTTTKVVVTTPIDDQLLWENIGSFGDTFLQVDTGVTQAVWAINTQGKAFTLINDENRWKQVDSLLLIQITSGENGVWGVDTIGRALRRVGIAPLSQEGSFWAEVSSPRLQQIESGADGLIFSIDASGKLYYRSGITSSRPSGTRWQLIRNQVVDISVGTHGAWIVDESYNVYYGMIERGQGDSLRIRWLRVEGTMSRIDAGFGGSVWALGINGELYRRIGISYRNRMGLGWLRVNKNEKYASVGTGLTGTYVVVKDTGIIRRTQDTHCGGVLTDVSGRITSPKYPNKYDRYLSCLWLIKSPNIESLTLRLPVVDLEGSALCSKDAVMVSRLDYRTGAVSGSPWVLCGTGGRSRVYDGSKLTAIEFITDGSNEETGFTLIYNVVQEQSVVTTPRAILTTTPTTPKITTTSSSGGIITSCGGLLTSSSGILAHPNYPGKYLQSTNCVWIIVAPSNYNVVFEVSSLDIESSFRCGYDYLEISNGGRNQPSSSVGKFCGTQKPNVIISDRNELRIVFKSDDTNERQGFLASWRFQQQVTTRRPVVTTTRPVVTTTRPAVVTTRPAIVTRPSQSCDTILTENRGTVRHPGYPSRYTSNIDCAWTIVVSDGGQVRLSVDKLSLNSDDQCRYDILEFYDGASTNARSLGSYCGKRGSFGLLASGNKLTIRFKSSNLPPQDGFSIRWLRYVRNPQPVTTTATPTITDCSKSFSGTDGIVSHPSYPYPYRSNLNCVYRFTVPQNQRVQLDFEIFKTEDNQPCRKDYIEIRDGSSSSSRLIGRYCGSTGPGRITSTSKDLYIRFKTDSSIGGRGFLFRWFAVAGQQTTPVPTTTAPPTPPSTGDDICNRGISVSGRSGRIVSPGYPSDYPIKRSCELLINAPSGYYIEITVRSIDIEQDESCRYDQLVFYNGDNERFPELRKLCGSAIPGRFSSTGNKVFVHFISDNSRTGKGFELVWQAKRVSDSTTAKPTPIEVTTQPTIATTTAFYTGQPPVCGGRTYEPRGSIFQPTIERRLPLNVTCVWIIETGVESTISLSFSDLRLDDSDCETSYIVIRDGMTSDAPELGRFCRNVLSTSVTTTGNVAHIEYRSDMSRDGILFRLDWNERAKPATPFACGGISTSVSGTITSPGFPRTYNNNEYCMWILMARPGRKLVLKIDFMDLEDGNLCQSDYLIIRDGDSSVSSRIAKVCGQQRGLTYTSTGNAMWIEFQSDCKNKGRGFRATWETQTLSGSPDRAVREIDEIEVPEITSTPFIPVTLPLKTMVLLENGNSIGGFISGVEGVIESPRFPANYPSGVTVRWHLQGPVNGKIHLKFFSFHLESDPECRYDYIKIQDGALDEPVTARYCGRTFPAEFIAGGNNMIVTFVSDRDVEESGFQATWMWIDDSAEDISLTPDDQGCGGRLNGESGVITSPLYPYNYPVNQDCTWFIPTNQDESVTLSFSSFDLESSLLCSFDYVEVREGLSTNGEVAGKFCGPYLPSNVVLREGGARINFKSDAHTSRKGFKINWQINKENIPRRKRGHSVDKCGGKIHSYSGILNVSPVNQKDTGQLCKWIIKAPHAKQIHLKIRKLPFDADASCERNKLQLYQINHTGEFKKITLCPKDVRKINKEEIAMVFNGHKIGIFFISEKQIKLNSLKVGWVASKDKPDKGSVKIASPFTLKGTNTGCGSIISNQESGFLQSPKYPSDYPTSVACVWKIHLPDQSKVTQLKFETFDLENDGDCRYDYVLVRDGDSHMAPIIGKFCGSQLPAVITSSSSRLWIRFYSDEMFNAKGFKASFTSVQKSTVAPTRSIILTTEPKETVTCGGDVTGSDGTIMSPGYPKEYPAATRCEWRLVPTNPEDEIEINMTSFDVENGGNRCPYDYVMVRDGVGAKSRMLGRFCGKTAPAPIRAKALTVVFATDASNQGQGFTFDWKILPKASMVKTIQTAPKRQCGGHQEGFLGILWSSNYPNQYDSNTNCIWKLESPHGTVIQLRFSNFDLESSEDCDVDYVSVFNGDDTEDDTLIGRFCGSKIPSIVSSTSNFMTVLFHTDEADTADGFEASWTAKYEEKRSHSEKRKRDSNVKPSGCGSLQTASSGSITSPSFPRQYPPVTRCVWVIKSSPSQIMTLNFDAFKLERDSKCKYDWVAIYDGPTASDKLLGKFCGRSIPNTIKTTSNVAVVEFHSDATTHDQGFKMNWKFEDVVTTPNSGCQRTFTKSAGTLVSPNYPTGNTARDICTWKIVVPIGYQIKVTFVDMNILNHPSCGLGYVQMHDGASSNSPQIGSFCGTYLPSPILSTTNELHIGYLSDGSSQSRGFKITWTAVQIKTTSSPPTTAPGLGCGREFTSQTGQVKLENGRRSCSWIIKNDAANIISLSFSNIRLSQSTECNDEYLEIKNGITSTATTILKICGSSDLRKVTAFSNAIKINYVLNTFRRGSSFQLDWQYEMPSSLQSLNAGSCGIIKNKSGTGPGALPWVAALIGVLGRVGCGATILTQRWLLSAAHCFQRMPSAYFWRARVGDYDLRSTESTEQNLLVERIYMHPEYDSKTNNNDIALVYLSTSIQFNDNVNSICLPTENTVFPAGKECSTAGWGSKKFLGKPSPQLIHVKPSIVSDSKCNSTKSYNGHINNNMICAGRDGGGIDSCQGDGGGALACNLGKGKYYSAGITSWGTACALPNKYGVYTKTSSYLTWIRRTVEGY